MTCAVAQLFWEWEVEKPQWFDRAVSIVLDLGGGVGGSNSSGNMAAWDISTIVTGGRHNVVGVRQRTRELRHDVR